MGSGVGGTGALVGGAVSGEGVAGHGPGRQSKVIVTHFQAPLSQEQR